MPVNCVWQTADGWRRRTDPNRPFFWIV